MSGRTRVSRRDFLKTGALVGGALVIGFHLPLGSLEAAAAAAAAEPFAPNAFLRIAGDGTVTFIINKSEMGQGVHTSLPMLIAEELMCDWQRVRVEAAPVAPIYYHTLFGIQVTGGSTSVRSEWQRLSWAGAMAREMLIAAAAARWGVTPGSCRAENGRVIDATGRSLGYGELAADAAKQQRPEKVELKKPEAWTILGKSRHRLDSPAKIEGQAMFGLDVRLPGMLTVLVERSPVFGGRLLRFSAERALKVPGVRKVVQVPTGVAVAADDVWSARKGREAVETVWDEGEWARLSTPPLREEFAKLAATPGLVARREGDPDTAFTASARRIEAEYDVPYLAHATMEPLNCCVDLRADGCDVWTGTQMQSVDLANAARITGLRPDQVRVHTMYLGGGFGRRANPASDFVAEAVEVAKGVGRPVKVLHTREDDMRGGYYRPMWYDRISAGLDGAGKLVAWRHTVVGQSIAVGTPFENAIVKDGIDNASVEGASDIPYAIPNLRVELHSPKLGVPVLWWRSVGHSHTAFVVESFLDEAALAAGRDPLEFRRSLLSAKPRHLGVLELAAAKGDWGKPLPKGKGRGIAVHESFGSFVAQVAEVSVNEGGRIRVERVVCAIDCGRTVNPDTIVAQMESGIIFGLSAVLHGAITLKDGRVEQGNFDSYPVVRMNEAPRMEVHIVPSREEPGGVGEPGVPPIAPAVANAVFSAAGLRLRRLPMTPDEVRRAKKG
jgi:isoquinoline 1-oxidoreductase beta subunit